MNEKIWKISMFKTSSVEKLVALPSAVRPTGSKVNSSYVRTIELTCNCKWRYTKYCGFKAISRGAYFYPTSAETKWPAWATGSPRQPSRIPLIQSPVKVVVALGEISKRKNQRKLKKKTNKQPENFEVGLQTLDGVKSLYSSPFF